MVWGAVPHQPDVVNTPPVGSFPKGDPQVAVAAAKAAAGSVRGEEEEESRSEDEGRLESMKDSEFQIN